MSLKLPSSPAFYRYCLSHTGGWTHLFNPDLSFRHYEIVLSSFFFLPLPFFFPSPNSPLPTDIGLRQCFSSSCSTNFLTLFGVPIFFFWPCCQAEMSRLFALVTVPSLGVLPGGYRDLFSIQETQNLYVKRLRHHCITS